ncbi:Hypothetical protein HDN1F_27300 [gamma proteobacterium HdN1]|nr:Hypothetical protein HDN1F_27300 [gamma proteobacterium HdN1]
MPKHQGQEISPAEKLKSIPDLSYYWLDLPKFRSNVQRFLAAFQRYYPRTKIAYSCKTNYLPTLIQAAYQLGCLAEVVSATEYDIAKRVGIKPQDIIYNGPVKSASSLLNAFHEGAQVHIDSVTEAHLAAKLLSEHTGPEITLGIRCTFPIDGNTNSQFGLDPTDEQARQAIHTLLNAPRVRSAGVHAHFSTRERSIASFRERTEKLLHWAETLIPPKQLAFIDVGGGFFGPMPASLQASFGIEIPSYEDYAEAVAGTLKRKFGNDGPELIIEPGAALVADVMGFCTEIVALKRSHGRVHGIVAGSLQNLRPTGRSTAPLPYHYEPALERNDAIAAHDAKIMGNTCMETDVLLDGFQGSLAVGDRFYFSNMGAYSWVFKPPFIAPAPAIYCIDDEPPITLVRRAETAEDMLATFYYKRNDCYKRSDE